MNAETDIEKYSVVHVLDLKHLFFLHVEDGGNLTSARHPEIL